MLAISNHATFIGGGEHSYFDLISHLPENYPVVASIPSDNELSKKVREKGLDTFIIPLPPISPMSIRRMAKTIFQFRSLCKDRNIHLIYANGSRAAFYGGMAGRMCSIPVVWHCRVGGPDLSLDGILLRLVDRVIANSRATATRFPLRYKKKIETVYNGFDLGWLRDADIKKPAWVEDNWTVLLVVARVSRWKRHDLVLAAFEKVAQTAESIHLICVGGKDLSESAWGDEMQARTRRHPFSDRVHWIGSVDDIRPWYRAASMLVLPSANEPFGRVIVEAMASGVPVIATASGGIPEVITHMQNGILIPEHDDDALYRAIMNVLLDNRLRNRIQQEGYKRSDHFNISWHVEKMLSIFNDVMNESGRISS